MDPALLAAVIILSVVCGLQSVALAATSALLLWRYFVQQGQIEKLDEAVAAVLEMAGVPKKTEGDKS